MTPEQCALVLSLTQRHISYPEFVTRSGLDPRGTPDFDAPLLQDALASRDPEVVECVLLLVESFRGWDATHVPALIELLVAPWHMKHEDVALALQELRDPRSVDALYGAALTKLPYLDYDDSHALARKCTWALADVGTPDARARLEALTKEADEAVATFAERRLVNWAAELGRKGPKSPGTRG